MPTEEWTTKVSTNPLKHEIHLYCKRIYKFMSHLTENSLLLHNKECLKLLKQTVGINSNKQNIKYGLRKIN